MKKILLLLFALMPLAAKCPSDYRLNIKESAGIRPYEQLWEAVCMVESSGNCFAINEKEQSYGISQIRQCRLDHYAKETGIYYTLTDCFDKEVSREIFMYFAEKIKQPERICRSWNGGDAGWDKPSTERYWRNIQKHLADSKY